jgi:hypothetical protein
MVAAMTPRPHAAEIERLLDMLAVARPEADAGRLLRRIGERVTHLALVEAQHRGGGRGGHEGRHRDRGAARPGSLADTERGDHAGADVVAERHGAQQVLPVAPRELARGQRRRHRAAAEMNRADRIGVVGFVGMGRHGVGERRIDGGRHDAGADHHRLGLAAKAVHIAGGEISGLETRAGHHRGQGIEHMQLGPDHDLGGQLAIEGFCHVVRERGGGGGDGILVNGRIRGSARRRDGRGLRA